MTTTATKYPNYSPGLAGVPAGITTICEINSDKSSLVYRGYNVHELAEHGSFEETTYLLLYKKLPTKAELDVFKEKLAEERQIPEVLYEMLGKLPKSVHLMDQIRTAFSFIAPFDPDYKNGDHDANIRKAIRIIAKAGIMVANGYRIWQGESPIAPLPELSIAGNFLYILGGGVKADTEREKMFDTALTLYAEHGFNASTFANRVTVSTLSDVYSGIVTGIGTLKGALHGGANEEAMKMLLEVGSEENAKSWLQKALAERRLIMGFGHREYKHGDSRAGYLSKLAKEVAERKGETKWVKIANVFEKMMFEEKGLHPNVDFPAAYAFYMLNIPIDLYTPIFVTARVSGWTAHAIEQLDDNKLIRPKAIYEGAPPTDYIALEERV